MAKGGFTAIAVANTKPTRDAAGEPVRTELPDRGCKGLYLVVQRSGAKSWAVRYRFRGKPRKLTLGPVLEADAPVPLDPVIDRPLTLASARLLAAGALREVEKGVDPAQQKRQEKAAAKSMRAELAGDTVENLKI